MTHQREVKWITKKMQEKMDNTYRRRHRMDILREDNPLEGIHATMTPFRQYLLMYLFGSQALVIHYKASQC